MYKNLGKEQDKIFKTWGVITISLIGKELKEHTTKEKVDQFDLIKI